jgi:hypothetical protein
MSKKILATMLFSLALVTFSAASESGTVPLMPQMFANARFVYVTSYDGNQFSPEVLPEDRAAIGHVQDAIQKWNKLTVVYRPQDADIILRVQSRPSEDVLAVYDAHRAFEDGGPEQAYLWRVMGRAGLQKGEMPLLSQFEQAWNKMAK